MLTQESALFCALFVFIFTLGCGGDDLAASSCAEEPDDVVEATIDGEPYIACTTQWRRESFDQGRGAEILQLYTSGFVGDANEATPAPTTLMMQVIVTGDAYAAKEFDGHHNMSGRLSGRVNGPSVNLTLGEIELHQGQTPGHLVGTFDGETDHAANNVSVSGGVFDIRLTSKNEQ